MTEPEILECIKLDDDALQQKLGQLQPTELETIRNVVTKPLKLSYAQRLVAKSFGISVTAEQQRFSRLIDRALADRTKITV